MMSTATAEVTPESLNYKMQKNEILKGLKETYTNKFSSKTNIGGQVDVTNKAK